MSYLSDDVTVLLSVTELDPEQIWMEAQMAHTDLAPDADLQSFAQGFALAAFLFGTDPDDDGGSRSTPDLPLLTGAA